MPHPPEGWMILVLARGRVKDQSRASLAPFQPGPALIRIYTFGQAVTGALYGEHFS